MAGFDLCLVELQVKWWSVWELLFAFSSSVQCIRDAFFHSKGTKLYFLKLGGLFELARKRHFLNK